LAASHLYFIISQNKTDENFGGLRRQNIDQNICWKNAFSEKVVCDFDL